MLPERRRGPASSCKGSAADPAASGAAEQEPTRGRAVPGCFSPGAPQLFPCTAGEILQFKM